MKAWKGMHLHERVWRAKTMVWLKSILRSYARGVVVTIVIFCMRICTLSPPVMLYNISH
jgi:hypothetical protein